MMFYGSVSEFFDAEGDFEENLSIDDGEDMLSDLAREDRDFFRSQETDLTGLDYLDDPCCDSYKFSRGQFHDQQCDNY